MSMKKYTKFELRHTLHKAKISLKKDKWFPVMPFMRLKSKIMVFQ